MNRERVSHTGNGLLCLPTPPITGSIAQEGAMAQHRKMITAEQIKPLRTQYDRQRKR
jgi:hypothetical protein